MILDELLPLVERPSRYVGKEVNARRKPWEDARCRVALVFPDLYEIGMSHLGLKILYHILNELPGVLADRAYCPGEDLESLLRESKVPLWGLESRRPLKEFDVLGISLPYELCYVNILTILDRSGIPFLASDRDASWPVVLGGGSAAVHAEPVADFFDAILVGDGEEAIAEIVACVSDWRAGGGSKEELLSTLAGLEGVYVPGLYEPRYEEDGAFLTLEPLAQGIGAVRRRVVSDLGSVPFRGRPVVPFLQIVHDRLGIEIARGCTRGCRFCQAGITYRPVREWAPNQVLNMAERALSASGWEEISLLSLSSGDYSCLLPLLTALMDRCVPEQVAVSLPSLRVGTLTPEVMEQIKRVRKTGFTLAPEAGSDRLRRVINKGIGEEDLLAAAAQAYDLGWSTIKLYFMIGLPTEATEDIIAIADLAKRVLTNGRRGSRGCRVNVSVGTFVPKPHTPFQWERQISAAESRDRLSFLKAVLRGRGLKLKWHDPWQSYLEGVFSRGDRRLAKVLARAWELGARFDAWGDKARPKAYQKAALELGMDLERYLAPRDPGAPLPWDHIDIGVDREYLERELDRAFSESFTPDCRSGECQGCGVCDFERVRPVVHGEKGMSLPLRPPSPSKGAAFSYHLSVSKLGEARFLSHLEVVHAFHRTARRSRLPLAYSEGFHPKPRLSFGPPVPVGTESLGEPLVLVLTEHLGPSDLMDRLNSELPEGLRVIEAAVDGSGQGLKVPDEVSYLIALPWSVSDISGNLAALARAETWPVARVRRGNKRIVDLKELVIALEEESPEALPVLPSRGEASEVESAARWPTGPAIWSGQVLRLCLRSTTFGGLKPAEIIGEVLGLGEKDRLRLRIIKLGDGPQGACRLVWSKDRGCGFTHSS